MFEIGRKITTDLLSIDPYPTFAQLREYEPVTWVPAFKFWMVTRYADTVAILRDAETFTMVPPVGQVNPMAAVFGPMMLSMDGPEHKRVRDVFMAPFRPKHVRSFYQQLVTQLAKQLVDDLAASQSIDLVADFSDKLAIYTVVATLGLDVNDIGIFRDWYDAFGAAIGNLQRDPTTAAAGASAFQKFEALITDQIERLQETPNSSVLSEIVHSQAGKLTRQQIVSNCALTFFGGVETTTSMLSNALWCILTEPQVQAQLRVQPDRLTQALEESLRYEAAVQSAMRFPTKDVELLGVPVKAGEKIYCMLGSANRDEAVFADGERFDLFRPNANKHLSFAYGPHFCFGAPLARLEAIVGIGKLLTQFPNMTLDPAQLTAPQGHEFRAPAALRLASG